MSGCWRSRPTNCTGSWTSCGTCAARPPGGTREWRSPSTPGGASRSVSWSRPWRDALTRTAAAPGVPPYGLGVVSAGLTQEGQELAERPGVDDVVGGEPAALRRADAEPQVIEVPGGVRVGVDRELDTGVPGRPDVVGWQVESLGVGVDLNRCAGRGAGAE